MTGHGEKPKPKVWNSLELCKLFATIATPVVVVVIGCLAWSAQRTIVERWERDQAEQRVSPESALSPAATRFESAAEMIERPLTSLTKTRAKSYAPLTPSSWDAWAKSS